MEGHPTEARDPSSIAAETEDPGEEGEEAVATEMVVVAALTPVKGPMEANNPTATEDRPRVKAKGLATREDQPRGMATQHREKMAIPVVGEVGGIIVFCCSRYHTPLCRSI